LDTLINEREKQLQQQQQGAQVGGDASKGGRDSTGMPETYTNRSLELDFVIAKHEVSYKTLLNPIKPTNTILS
jgi:hypothetical protein